MVAALANARGLPLVSDGDLSHPAVIDEVGCPQCGHGSRGLAGYQSGRADEVEET